MTESDFKTALREIVSRDFSNIPESESQISYKFSDAFLYKMNKLIKVEQHRTWKMTNTTPKRVAIILASILVILLTACSFPKVRGAVVNFFKDTYETCVRFFVGEEGTTQISDYYVLCDIPEGFTETDAIENDSCSIHLYQNDKGDRIILSQSITADYAIDIDNEHGTLHDIIVSGMNVSIYESKDNACIVAIWLNDGYAFDLTTYGNWDITQIIHLISQIKRQ